MNYEAYADYLKTDRWQEQRSGALTRAADHCQVCNGTDRLEVHHRTYERLGDERPEDLTVLCDSCHDLFHERMKPVEAEAIMATMNDLYGRINEQMGGPDPKMSGLPSGYCDLDQLTAGFHGGQLIVISSYPDVGKSTFLLNLARTMKVPALFVSPEHSRLEVSHRLLMAEALVDGHAFRRGVVNAEMMSKCVEAGDRIKDLPLFLDTENTPSTQRIASYAHKFKTSKNIQAVFIDCLELIQSGVTTYRPEQIATIARELKALARELDLPVIVIARAVGAADRQDHRPRLADFGTHSAIPQEADMVLILHAPSKYEEYAAAEKNDLEVIVAKQRNGPYGEAVLTFYRPCFRIDNKVASSVFK